MDTKELKRLFSEKRPADWDQIPDIDLYMDQVTSYMQRQHIGFEVNENLTPAMINNYVKQKVMPKANGKKYDRDHIAYLTAIVLLKQVISVGDVKTLLGVQLADEDIRGFYEKFTGRLDKELTVAGDMISEDLNEKELSDLALGLAVSSYAQKLACECILDILSGDEDENSKKKK